MNDLWKERFDVVIVGAGLGGLSVGALLAVKEHKRVLLLEKDAEVGGRAVTFCGEDLNVENYKKRLASAGTWVVRSKPDLSTIMQERLLSGYRIEVAQHGIAAADRGRFPYILKEVGKNVPIYPYEGYKYFHGGRFHKVEKGGRFSWMTDEDFEETRKVSRIIYNMSVKEAEKYDHVSVKSFLKEITNNPAALEFHTVMATWTNGISDPAAGSAGEQIKMSRQIVKTGYHISIGGAGLPDPGYSAISDAFAEAIREHGGRIQTNTPVKKIIVEDGKATGVIFDVEGKSQTVNAPIIVSNLPIKQIFGLIPERHFPKDFVKTVKGFWSAGVLDSYMGLKRAVFKEKDTCCNPKLLTSDEGYEGNIVFSWTPSSNIVPSRAPAGKQLIETFTGITDKEAHDRKKLDRIMDRAEEFLAREFPGYPEVVDWQIWVASDYEMTVAQAPGQVWDKKPDVKCPWIEGLYFVGDSVRCWGCATDMVAHAALLCASSITGKDYLQIIPEYMR